MVFEEENSLRINNFIEINGVIAITERTHRIRWFDGTMKDLKVVKVPIEFLTYNFDNMRIEGQLIEELNKLGSELDFENLSDREIYAGIFEDTLQRGSDKTKTSKLKKSISNTQQEVPGIITNGGIILDGNRRYMVIRQLYQEEKVKTEGNYDKYKHMDVVRLDSGLSKSQLLAIQTFNQLFIDERVNYTLINQALAVRKLKSFNYSKTEIAKMFNLFDADVEEFEEVLNLIELYLEDNDIEKKYTIIDKRNLFDHFRELRKLNRGHARYTGLQGVELDRELDLMQELAFKWLKNNIDPEMIAEKKVMKSREVIRKLNSVVHRNDLRNTVEKVLSLDENVSGKREVHKLMTAAINSIREGEKEEKIYTLAEQISDKLDGIQNVIDEGETEIDEERLLGIMEQNQEKINDIIFLLKEDDED